MAAQLCKLNPCHMNLTKEPSAGDFLDDADGEGEFRRLCDARHHLQTCEHQKPATKDGAAAK